MKIRPTFDFEFITKVVLELRDSGLSVGEVSKRNKVPIAQVYEWRAKYSKTLYEAHPVVIKDVKQALLAKREVESQPLRDKATALADAMLDRLLDDLASNKKVDFKDLVAGLKDVFPYIMPKFEGDKNNVKGGSIETTYTAFMENIYNKYQNNVIKETITVKSTKKE